MDNQKDNELDEWLNCYEVKGADDVLMQRILHRARTEQVQVVSPFQRIFLLPKFQMAMAACIALAGFFLGGISSNYTNTIEISDVSINTQNPAASTQTSPSQGVSIDKIIFAPTTIKEVLL